MACSGCHGSVFTRGFATLSRAAVKKATSVVRSWGAVPMYPEWRERVEVCARCPISHKEDGTLYCGKPLLRMIERRAEDGCGCPVMEKALDQGELCPVERGLTGRREVGACDCKWCAMREGQGRE